MLDAGGRAFIAGGIGVAVVGSADVLVAAAVVAGY